MNRQIFNFKTDGNRINPFYALVFLFFVIVALILWTFRPEYQYNKNQTYIDNLSDYATPSAIPFVNRDELYRALNSAIRDNSAKPPFYGALIRQDSYQYYSIAPYIIASRFTVDIPTIEQSYSAFVTWSIDSAKSASNFKSYIEFSCLPFEQNIYQDFSCVEPKPFYPDRVGNPENYLPFTSYTDDNSTPIFTISKPLSLEDKTLNISINCNTSLNSPAAKKLESSARAWLQDNTSISLDDYKLQLSASCDGDAI